MATGDSAIPLQNPAGTGLLRVVSEGDLQRSEREESERRIEQMKMSEQDGFQSDLAAFVRKAFDSANWHREGEGIEQDMLRALRAVRGRYDPEKMQQIKQFSGSEVYSRLTAVKCRGAAAILRDVYLTGDRPWTLRPTPEPQVPNDVMGSIMQLVRSEVGNMQLNGMPVDPTAIQERVKQLEEEGRKVAQRQARDEAREATKRLDDILTEGGFYDALRDFLIDLPIFDFACIKGPVVRKANSLKWGADGSISVSEDPKMFWYRVSPFDLWFAPGANDASTGHIMERVRLTRDELYDCIGLPGYDEAAIRRVLEKTADQGLADWRSTFDTERADLEKRENPAYDAEGPFIDSIEFHGYVRGKLLMDWDVDDFSEEVTDEDKEYYITAWLIDRDLIKVHINPNPRKRSLYYVTSFEKVPGSIYGHGLPNILHDIQEVANATLRSLVNNLSIASGPQVVVDDDRMAPNADSDSLYPWKRWHIQSDPYGKNQQPVVFYQPNSNAQELLVVYEKFTQMADEVSAIPRYLTGSERVGGAASTASGLSMLMNNASKVMQQVAANIDRDILEPMLQQLYDMVMLTDQGRTLRGDETIEVMGVTTAIQREQDRVRQLEFLQLTANPIDAPIIGPERRASLLREVAQHLGMDWDLPVPSRDELQQQQEAAQRAAQQQAVENGGTPAGPNEGNSDAAGPHLNTQSNGRSTVG